MGRQTPSDYLNSALAIIEARALSKGKVDWKLVRAKTSELAADAKNTADTYGAINFALEQAGRTRKCAERETSPTPPENVDGCSKL